MCVTDHAAVLLLQIRCRWCGRVFCICRCCWRGQRYCCAACRQAAKCQAHREAQRRYRRTEKGKKTHREAEKRRWIGLSQKTEEILDDATSTLRGSSPTMQVCRSKELEEKSVPSRLRIGRCALCGVRGVIVGRFPRRGYSKGHDRLLHRGWKK